MNPIKKNFDAIAMAQYRYSRLQSQLSDHDCTGALLFNSRNISYASGTHYASISNMHSPTRAIFVPAVGKAIFYDSEMNSFGDKPDVIGEYRNSIITAYFLAGESFSRVTQNWIDEISGHIGKAGEGRNRLAIDLAEPQLVIGLHNVGIDVVNADKLVSSAGEIKSDDEFNCIRNSIDIAEAGLGQIKENLKPGISEQALWSYLALENERNGGGWFDYKILSSGERTNPWGQEASDKPIKAGELVTVDTGMVGPFGYSADISRTFFCGPGDPTAEQSLLYQTARENLAFNIDLICAGMSYREFAEKSWKVPDVFWSRRYNCVAHGVGMGNQWPHIKFIEDWPQDENDDVLKENMVIAMESCIGKEDGIECVKLEEMVMITKSGCRVLSTFPFEENF